MRDLIKRLLRENIKNGESKILSEARSWIEQHCDEAFDSKQNRYFCYAATKAFKNSYSLQESVRDKLKKFVEQNEELISSINIETLEKTSPIATKGFEEFKWVQDNGRELCPNIRVNMVNVYNQLLGGKHVLYVDDNGDYHVINRLDTNYSALGVMFTEYFANRDIPYILGMRGLRSKISWEKPVLHLINNVLYPYTHNPESYETNILRNLDLHNDALKTMFRDLIREQQPGFEPKTIRVLHRVRESGFDTERKFMKLLDENGIEFKNFGKDYGFVDRFLGIDLFVKIRNLWVPAQVKTTKQEKTLIDTLGCEGFLEVFQKDGKFYVNNFEFNRYFCQMLEICNKNQETD